MDTMSIMWWHQCQTFSKGSFLNAYMKWCMIRENSTKWENVPPAFSGCRHTTNNLSLDFDFFLLITLFHLLWQHFLFFCAPYLCTDMLTENFHQTQSIIAATDLLNWSFVLGVLTTSPPVQARLCEDKSRAADIDMQAGFFSFLKWNVIHCTLLNCLFIFSKLDSTNYRLNCARSHKVFALFFFYFCAAEPWRENGSR